MTANRDEQIMIVGQGLAGTCLAWRLWDRGRKFRIVDRGGNRGSSFVAAGMLSPVTGKAMNASWRVGDFLPEAMQFYETIEMILGEQFFHRVPILRLFGEERERNKFESKRDVLAPWIEEELGSVGVRKWEPGTGFVAGVCAGLETSAPSGEDRPQGRKSAGEKPEGEVPGVVDSVPVG